MRKMIAIILASCLLLCVTGCASQKDLDAVLAEQEALKADNDILRAAADKYSDMIIALDNEDYDTARSIISEKQLARDTAGRGDIDDYLVTVELTMDNFDDYFEWKVFYGLNAFGEVQKNRVNFLLTSKVYDQGLVLYEADAAVGFIYTDADLSSHGKITYTSDEKTGFLRQNNMPSFGAEYKSGEYMIEGCYAETTRVSGTVTFVKASYVTSYNTAETRNDGVKRVEIQLMNGEMIDRLLIFGCQY